jgi:transcriptional regulator with XRE-family HTH domain
MRRRGFTQADAARYLGWNEAYLCRLLSDNEGTKKGIGLDNALHLETLAGIPVEAWKSNEVDESETDVVANGSKRKVSR